LLTFNIANLLFNLRVVCESWFSVRCILKVELCTCLRSHFKTTPCQNVRWKN